MKKKPHIRRKKASSPPGTFKKIREIMGKPTVHQYDIATSTGPQYLNPDNGR